MSKNPRTFPAIEKGSVTFDHLCRLPKYQRLSIQNTDTFRATQKQTLKAEIQKSLCRFTEN